MKQVEFLSVPIELDVLSVNRAVLKRDTFRLWPFEYTNMEDYQSPEPTAFDNQQDVLEEGIRLSWSLPRALRSGKEVAGGIEFPLVPNRWLIVRYIPNMSHAMAWVLESDCPVTDDTPTELAWQASKYLVDTKMFTKWNNLELGGNRAVFQAKNNSTKMPYLSEKGYLQIGIPFLLDNWEELGKEAMFLTALAPSNTEFSVYTKHCSNVFSFCDELEGIDKGEVSYFVTGWYSDATKDILQLREKDEDFNALCQRLKWKIKDSTEDSVRSLYSGYAFSVPWDRNGKAPQEDKLANYINKESYVGIAVGHNSIDAQAALIGNRLSDGRDDEEAERTSAFLRMFQYDMLSELDKPGGDVLAEQAAHTAGFASSSGGTRWEIRRRESTGENASLPLELTREEQDFLAKVNRDQQALDTTKAVLADCQWRVNAAYWKQGHLNAIDTKLAGLNGQELNQRFDELLDSANPHSLVNRMKKLENDVKNLMSRLPHSSDNADEYQNNISAFSKGNIRQEYVLYPVAKARYWNATDPVIAIGGVKPPHELQDEELYVRSPEELVQSISREGQIIRGESILPSNPVTKNKSLLPNGVPELFHEFLLLEEIMREGLNQQESHINIEGKLPEKGLKPWSQPWEPMYVEWKAEYRHVPHTDGNWKFDGTDYHLTDHPTAEKRTTIVGGRAVLSDHETRIFASRLEAFAKEHKEDWKDLPSWIEQIGNWNIMTQQMSGFYAQLSQRDIRTYRSSISEENLLCQLSVPYMTSNVETKFHGIYEGEFYFTDIIVYDKFGRTLLLILSNDSFSGNSGVYSAKNFRFIRDRQLLPNPKAEIMDASFTAEQKPRTTQPMRLDVLFADHRTDAHIMGEEKDVQPVGGFLIPNHLNHSLLLFTPDGGRAGELRLVKSLEAGKYVHWASASDEPLDLLTLSREAPCLYNFILSMKAKSENDFHEFMETIDHILWTTSPLKARSEYGLSILAGRPLALARVAFKLSLDGPVMQDAGWEGTFRKIRPPFLDYTYELRLGNPIIRRDGLIGYFEENQYDTFHSTMTQKGLQSDFIHEIGPLESGDNYIHLKINEEPLCTTLLLDPTLPFHSFTGLLPVKETSLPPHTWEKAMSAIELSFRMGPILTRIRNLTVEKQSKDNKETNLNESVLKDLPKIVQKIEINAPDQAKNWLWKEKRVSESDKSVEWSCYETSPAATTSQYPSEIPSLREGVLQLNPQTENEAEN